MKRAKVLSSNIISIGYESKQHLLYVTFSSGSEYVYEHVPEKLYKDFLVAKSKGRFFGINIRKNYKGEKIR